MRTFGNRVLSPSQIAEMLRQRTNYTTGQLLTSTKLARFVHPPDQAATGSVHLDFLQGLPVPERLREHGIPLGVNTNRGVPIPIFQPLHQHNKNSWMIGASRKGKSNEIIHLCRFLATQGQGVGLIDPHRTTAFDRKRLRVC